MPAVADIHAGGNASADTSSPVTATVVLSVAVARTYTCIIEQPSLMGAAMIHRISSHCVPFATTQSVAGQGPRVGETGKVES